MKTEDFFNALNDACVGRKPVKHDGYVSPKTQIEKLMQDEIGVLELDYSEYSKTYHRGVYNGLVTALHLMNSITFDEFLDKLLIYNDLNKL